MYIKICCDILVSLNFRSSSKVSDKESEARLKSVQSAPAVVLTLNSSQQIIIIETRKEVEPHVSVKPELK